MSTSEQIVSAPADLTAEYDLVRELGSGGTAVVYLARDRRDGRDVAIKVIRGGFATDREALARLAREARTVARLEHPNIVRVREVKQLADGGFALVMQYVPGRTLRDALRRSGAAPLARAEHVLRDIARALAHAHGLGIVHRDVKPENIFLDDTTGRALLSDFGIARSVEGDSDLTLTGVAIGTPTYMSPEQIDGARVDGRSDVYSLGIVGWEMLAGKRPWAGETLYSVIYRQKNEPLPRVRDVRADAPESLQFAIDGALLKNRDQRLPSAEAFLAQLDGLPDAVAARDNLAEAIVAERATLQVLPPESTETVRFRRPVQVAIPTEEPAPPARRWAVPAAMLLLAGALAVAAAVGLRHRDGPRGTVVATAPAVDRSAPGPAATASDTTRTTGASAPPATSDSGATPGSSSTPTLGGVAVRDTPIATAAADQRPTLPVGTRADTHLTRAPVPPTRAAAAPLPAAAPSGSEARTADASGGAAGATGAVATAASPAPSPPPRPASAVLAAGGLHSCMLAQGTAYCWGSNDAGQLGDGSRTRRPSPTVVSGNLQLVAVSAGISHTCGVTAGGKAYCWGSNDRGQLGDGTSTSRSEPAPVADAHAFTVIRAGMSHTCALTAAGEAYCWGADQYGQLGDGGRTDRRQPVRARLPEPAADLALGWGHTCALTRRGAVFCWGQNGAGQLGDGTTTDRLTPTAVAAEVGFASLAAGSRHTCAATAEGAVYCWGQNSYGQLGDGSTTDRARPARVQGAPVASAVTAGSVHTCALARDGDAYCWGRNTYGQVGDGTMTDRATPVRVQGGHAFALLQANGAHSCGTTPSGEIFCWGYNVEGQLGDGSRTHRARPVYVEKPGG